MDNTRISEKTFLVPLGFGGYLLTIEIYVLEPVDYVGHGTCTIQTSCVRSTHARDTLSKFLGRHAEYVDVSSRNARH